MNNNNILGILLSVLCILHCTLPFLALATSLNTISIFIEHSKIIHIFLFLMVFVVYLIVFPRSYINQRRLLILLIATSGVLLLFFALFFEGNLETITTLIGALLLLYAHYKNRLPTDHKLRV